jgi:hypothetical protein
MKVRIVLTVDVDPEAWANEYGVDRSEVREDVKRYVGTSMHDWASSRDLINDVECR